MLAGHGLGESHMLLDSGDGFFTPLDEMQYLKSGRVTQYFQQAGSSSQTCVRWRFGVSFFHDTIYYANRYSYNTIPWYCNLTTKSGTVL